jgi:putative aldouronate transport system substrate-binding protein
MKRILIAMLALAMLASPAFAATVPEPGVFPIVDEKITLTFFVQQLAQIEDITTNEFTLWYEDKTNVRIEWEVVPSDVLGEKRTLVYASGDYPDAFFSGGVTKSEELLYSKQGVFLPLNDLIERYGVETKRMFEKTPYVKEAITTPDGSIYSLPQVNETYHASFPQKMWINQTWLDKLGLAMPATADEFRAVLTAFKEQDPNGNGVADEIPITAAAIGGNNTFIDGFLMCAFIYNDSANRLMVTDGVVDLPVTKDAWREGLRYLHGLYEEGLIDPAAFTQDRAQMRTLITNPDAVTVGAFPAFWFGHIIPVDSALANEYEPVPPLAGPEGVQTTYYAPPIPQLVFEITTACKYPEAAFRWADWLYTEEGTFGTTYGREGQEWEYIDPSEGLLGINDKPAVWRRLGVQGATDNIYWHQLGPSFRDSDFRLSEAAAEDPYTAQGYETRLFRATKLYEPYAPAQTYPDVYMTPEQANSLQMYKTMIDDYIKESTARFIIGDLDVEKDWEGYVSALEGMGIKEYVAIYQEAYDAAK